MAEEHFVDKHRAELIQRVTNIAPILDELLVHTVINQESYDEISAIHDSRGRMRALLSGPLESSGVRGKHIFYKILERNEPHLIDYLNRMESETVMGMKVMHTVEVDTMMLKKLVIEILNDLSSGEFTKFKSILKWEKDFPLMSRRQLGVADTHNIVELMVETYGRGYVEVTKMVLKEMNRTDVLQRLSAQEPKRNTEHRPTLIQKVETMTSVIELLLETLADLSYKELKYLKEVLLMNEPYLEMLMMADMQDTVFFVVQTFGQQSVEKTQDILNKMNRRDLVLSLSHSSSRPKKKHHVDEHLSAVIHKVATKMAVSELLLETLNDLSDWELNKFKWFLQFAYFKKGRPCIPWSRVHPADRTEVVELMVERCGQQSVEVTREVFMEMKRTDLVQRLSETSSGPKVAGSSVEAEGEKHSVDEQWPALIQKVETMMSVIELLLETLADLSNRELKDFRQVFQSQLRFTSWGFVTPWWLLNMQEMVVFMVQAYGQQSMEVTKKVFKDINRTDLVQKLSDCSSGATKERTADELSALVQNAATITERLLDMLQHLGEKDFKGFKGFLHKRNVIPEDLPCIPWRKLEEEDMERVADLMQQTYTQRAVEVAKIVFKKIHRNDLVKML